MNPGAIKRTIKGEIISPIKVNTDKDAKDTLKSTFETRRNSLSSPFALYSVNTGTIAALVAPSPTISLKEFGILKATKKACAARLVPKKFAITISRRNPRTLLIAVAAPITPVDLIKCFLSMVKILDYKQTYML